MENVILPQTITGSNILVGYTSQERPYKVDNYPWGFRLRTSIHYWIESKPGKGDRFCSYTIDPKTGRACKPKCSTYITFMYMYINEEGHVTYGTIDSYKPEEFRMRFNFILTRIGEQFISDVQKQNIRINYAQHVRGNAPWEAVKYSDEKKPEFIQWVKETLIHILKCPFAELVNHPDRPVEDRPDGEVKFVVSQ